MFSALSILLASSAWTADGHGYMTNPKIRKIDAPPGRYEPQSVGAAGPGQRISLCGKNADNYIEGKDVITQMPTPGSEYKFQAKITAHHYGHMIVRVCPFINGGTDRKDLKKNCIRLKGVGGSGTWPLSAGTGAKEWKAVLPSKAELEAMNSPQGVFTIIWRWNTANSCKASDTLEDRSNCNEEKCCSEVFTNCADVVFQGIANEAPGKPVKPRPRPIPAPGPRPGGGGSSSNVCVAKGGWKGQVEMDGWCASTHKCGADGGDSCDCSCSGGGGAEPEPEPEVEHKIKPNKKAARIFKGLLDFCKANKDYYCDTTRTQDVAPQLCDCAATKPADPEPEPEPTGPGPTSAPEPEPTSAPEPADPEDGDVAEDSLNFNQCKDRCQKMCNKRSGGVKTNQGWGSPRYIHCKCDDGFEKKFAGCECKNARCPESMKLSQVAHSTKFAGGVQKQMEIAAHGETLNMD